MIPSSQALALLRQALGQDDAEFRSGQWQAIDALVNHKKRLLVIERTGWGKSWVYFLSTLLLRQQGLGPSIVVSPLLALMRNQLASAQRLGLKAEALHSNNPEQWPEIQHQLLNNQLDCLLLSPERLANPSFGQQILTKLLPRLSLVVIDEAHCIAEWGQHFRPDYAYLHRFCRQLSPNCALLATTATADAPTQVAITQQLGKLQVQRGSLDRPSLQLDCLHFDHWQQRLAWLSQALKQLPGSGILYCRRRQDCLQVAQYLQQQGIVAQAYYSNCLQPGFRNSADYRHHLEDLLLANGVKALVATNALGMGFDKADLAFVIHLQAPSSLMAYYQQAGRAGRGLAKAHAILLTGPEDHEWQQVIYRLSQQDSQQINRIIHRLSQGPCELPRLAQAVGLPSSTCLKLLKIMALQHPQPVALLGGRWHLDAKAAKAYQPRPWPWQHWQQVQDYCQHQRCLMASLQSALGEPSAPDCGRCSVCLGKPLLDIKPPMANGQLKLGLWDEPRESSNRPEEVYPQPLAAKTKPLAGAFKKHYAWAHRAKGWLSPEPGWVFCGWQQGALGQQLAKDVQAGDLSDHWLLLLSQWLQQQQLNPMPRWLTWVPSLHQDELRQSACERLARLLDLPLVCSLELLQCPNPGQAPDPLTACQRLDGAWRVTDRLAGPVLLLDLFVDSGWQLAIASALLRRAGCPAVVPLALARRPH